VDIQGIGPMAATGLIVAIGNGGDIHKARARVVPDEYSAGGKQKVLGIVERSITLGVG
jgi:hypothetical protein